MISLHSLRLRVRWLHEGWSLNGQERLGVQRRPAPQPPIDAPRMTGLAGMNGFASTSSINPCSSSTGWKATIRLFCLFACLPVCLLACLFVLVLARMGCVRAGVCVMCAVGAVGWQACHTCCTFFWVRAAAGGACEWRTWLACAGGTCPQARAADRDCACGCLFAIACHAGFQLKPAISTRGTENITNRQKTISLGRLGC